MFGSLIGPDEAVLLVGLIVLTIGLWPVLDRVALTVPGAVLVWMSLPSRSALIQRPTAEPTRRKRT